MHSYSYKSNGLKFGHQLPLIATVVPHLSKQKTSECSIRVFSTTVKKRCTAYVILSSHIQQLMSTAHMHTLIKKKNFFPVKKKESASYQLTEICDINVRPRMLLDCMDN